MCEEIKALKAFIKPYDQLWKDFLKSHHEDYSGEWIDEWRSENLDPYADSDDWNWGYGHTITEGEYRIHMAGGGDHWEDYVITKNGCFIRNEFGISKVPGFVACPEGNYMKIATEVDQELGFGPQLREGEMDMESMVEECYQKEIMNYEPLVEEEQEIYETSEDEEEEEFSTIPKNMPYCLNDILTCKSIDLGATWRDYKALVKFDAETNPRKFCGNKTIYQYQFQELIKCRRGVNNYKTIEEWFADPVLKDKLWQDSIKRNRRKKATQPSPTDVYECHRINNGAIVPFKSSTAKYIYKKFGAKSVLDPTMGWGGRMLGATSLGINYIGFDTNTDLRNGYEQMITDLKLDETEEHINLYWRSSLNEDIISELNYDMVLTSPPYEESNKYMEVYEHSPPWTSEEQFYMEFLIPLMDLCYKYLAVGGKSCWNISPKMYKKLTTKYLYTECDSQEDLRQQLGSQYKTKSQDYIYIWTK